MSAIWTGLVTGLGLAMSTGPIFFMLLQTSIKFGFRQSIRFIAGVSLADSSLVALTWFGLNQLNTTDTISSIMGLVGGVVLICFGISFVIQRKKESSRDIDRGTETRPKSSGLFLKGLSVNILNPIVWAFWGAMSQYAIDNFTDEGTVLLFFLTILLTIFTTDLIKSYFAQKLTPYLKSSHVQYLSIGVGLLLIFFGVKLILDFLSV